MGDAVVRRGHWPPDRTARPESEDMNEERRLDSAIHYYLVRGLIDDGFAPDSAKLQELVAADAATVAEAFKRLEASHSLICHAGHTAPWVIHPFSLSPTATWVQAGKLGWWAPCIWCALGVGVLVGEDVVIHSRIGGEAKGAVVPIAQVAHLAQLWYGKHADRGWEKWSVAQARKIFGRVGLTGPFWALEAAEEENRF